MSGVLRTRGLRLALLVLISVLAVLLPPATASAGPTVGAGVGPSAAAIPTPAPAPAPVTWSVVPADEAGPDGRVTVTHEIAPGEAVTEHVAIHNLGTQDVTFDVTANDGYLTPAGSFDMRPSSHEPEGLGAWIESPADVTVPAGASVVVPFTIAVPSDAAPGDYSAGIAASVVVPGSGGLATESRVGVRITARVPGEVVPAIALEDVSARYEQSWNPAAPGRVVVAATARNTGTVRVRASLESGGVATEPAEILPGESRVLVLERQSWPIGRVGSEVTLAATVVPLDGAAPVTVGPVPVTATVSVWALPLPQLLAALLLVALAVALSRLVRGTRARRRAARAAELATAREQGRREALGSEPFAAEPR